MWQPQVVSQPGGIRSTRVGYPGLHSGGHDFAWAMNMHFAMDSSRFTKKFRDGSQSRPVGLALIQLYAVGYGRTLYTGVFIEGFGFSRVLVVSLVD